MPADKPHILPVRQQADLIAELLRERLSTLLPEAMRKAGIDAWIVVCNEDNPDPLYATMITMDTWCPILSMLLFVDEGDAVRRYNIGGTRTRDLYERPYTGQLEAEQWSHLTALLAEHDPRTIGIDIGEVAWCAGGLTHVLHRALLQNLPEKLHGRLVSAEKAAVHWASHLTEREQVLFERVSELGQYMIRSCLSDSVVTPGVTTVDDLVWHYWQHATDLGLGIAFKPHFGIRRDARRSDLPPDVIHPGDVIHCDVGIKYLRMNSDHQHLAYVPRVGESDAPPGLKRRMAETNRLQEIYMQGFHAGATGNQLLAEILERARGEDLDARVYSHNLGLFLHQPGPLIGLPWEQADTGPRGEVALEPDMAFVMEISTDGPVPEWGGQVFRCEMEEPVLFTRDGCRTLCPPQTGFHII